MENLNTQSKGNHTLLVGVEKAFICDTIWLARQMQGKWYVARMHKKLSEKIIFEEIPEIFVKGMLFLFDGSGLQVDDTIIENMSSFLAKSIGKHLQAKSKMEAFFEKIG